MSNSFHPIMQPAAVQSTVNYYYQTFTALGPVGTFQPHHLATLAR
jgi:hypothetical protein